MKYQLEGRYPEYYPKVPSAEKINDYLISNKRVTTMLQQGAIK